MVFEQLLRYSPRRRALPRIAEGFSPTASPAYRIHFSKTINRACSSATHRQDEHTIVPGRASPSQTLPRAGGWGNPVSPSPCVRARPPRGRGTGVGVGVLIGRPQQAPRGRGYGGTWFPHGHVRRSCAWRTPSAAHGPGAPAGRPRHGSAGTMTAPSLTLPRRGREPGSSPSGGAGRGVEPCERWSPQERGVGAGDGRGVGVASRLKSRPGVPTGPGVIGDTGRPGTSARTQSVWPGIHSNSTRS